MKSFSALTTLLVTAATTTVSAAPVIEQRQATAQEFDITNFSANTQPHGTAAFISYDISIPGAGVTTRCTYSDQTSVGRLPSVPFRACDNAAVDWQFHQQPSVPGAEGNYLIVVRYLEDPATGRKVAGFKEWPDSDFPVEQYGAAFAQFFRGEPDFVIGNLS